MLVAKLPGSTYATAATKAGPRNGTSARRPRVWPLRAFSAARKTRSSPGSATTACSIGALVPGGFVPGRPPFGGRSAGGPPSLGVRSGGGLVITLGDEHSPGKPKRDVYALALDPDLDG